MLYCWTKHHQGSQDPLRSCSRTTSTSQNVFPYQLVWIYVWSGFCMGKAEHSSLRFFATMHMKDQVLGNIFRGTFLDSFWQNLSLHPHCQNILLSTSSGIFWLFVEIVYWLCGLKFVYLMVNLAFLGIIVKVKLPVKFCLQFWMILSPNK